MGLGRFNAPVMGGRKSRVETFRDNWDWLQKGGWWRSCRVLGSKDNKSWEFCGAIANRRAQGKGTSDGRKIMEITYSWWTLGGKGRGGKPWGIYIQWVQPVCALRDREWLVGIIVSQLFVSMTSLNGMWNVLSRHVCTCLPWVFHTWFSDLIWVQIFGQVLIKWALWYKFSHTSLSMLRESVCATRRLVQTNRWALRRDERRLRD